MHILIKLYNYVRMCIFNLQISEVCNLEKYNELLFKIRKLLDVRRGEYLILSLVESSIKEVFTVHLLSHISRINRSAGQYSSLLSRTMSPI